jgi:hypothetical protein
MRSEDLDPCPTSLVISYEMKTPGTSDEDNDGRLGSRVDTPQKPNCRSLVQGIERQGLRRHLPSRSFVRVELRDGITHSCGWTVILRWFCSCVPNDRGSLLILSRKEAKPRDGQLNDTHSWLDSDFEMVLFACTK